MSWRGGLVRRGGVSLVEALVALAVGAIAIVAALEFFNAGGRLFGRVQSTLDVEGDGRILVVNLVRDLSEAHRIRPPEAGDALRVVRFAPDIARDFASRTVDAYVNGALAPGGVERSFACQEVRYRRDAQGLVTRTEVDGTWKWSDGEPARVSFTPSGAPRVRELARAVTRLAVELLGYDRAGKLDLIAGLPEEDLLYRGDEARHAAAALALVRVTTKLDAPAAKAADQPRELDIVTRVWREGARAEGVARVFPTSADERRR